MKKTKQIPVPIKLHTQFHHWCIENNITITRATAQAIAMYLATDGKEAQP
jgi:hypothetical protein